MRHIVGLLHRFRKEEDGAFAVIFGVIAIVLVAMGGAAVDFTSIQQARTRTQAALDAAALALQPSIYSATTATIQSQAQALLVSQLADGATSWADCTTTIPVNKAPCVTVATPVVSTAQGQITLTANLNVQMNFVSLVGVPQIAAQIVSVATRKKLALEVAMVLDNSGSMAIKMGQSTGNGSPSRMGTLQDAAVCASNILFYGVSTCGASTTGLTANSNVKIGVVPFTQFVNVGASNANTGWIDRTGAASITLNNFDNDDNPTTPFTGPIDRIALANSIKTPSGTTVGWGGCVEARKNPYDTDDTPPTTGDTLYTPAFAPDEPGSTTQSDPSSHNPRYTSSYNSDQFASNYLSDIPSQCTYAQPTCKQIYTKTGCSSSSYTSCNKTATLGYTWTIQGATTSQSSCGFMTEVVSSTTTYGSTGSGSNYTDTATTSTQTSNRALQERMCKYGTTSNRVSMTYAPTQSQVYGPNGDCTANAILPLSSSPSDVVTAINAMAAQGGTNITEGSIWGWHVLSPDSPFTSKGAAYSNSTSKVMIIMTDGENTIYPSDFCNVTNMNNDCYYSAYGYPWNMRLGVNSTSGATLKAVMDSRLSTICTNAKAVGVTVYTIAVDVGDTTDPTGNTTLLTNCATPTGSDGIVHHFLATSTTDLEGDFVNIAKQLAALRIAQ